MGSHEIYVKVPNNPAPKQIQAEVVVFEGPAIIGNMSAQNLNLLKLNWPITANQCGDDPSSHKDTNTYQVIQNTKVTPNLHTIKLFNTSSMQHPFPLTKKLI